MNRLSTKPLIACFLAGMFAAIANAADPELPQSEPSTTLPTGWDGAADVTVSSGGNLQTAINNAVQNGDGLYIIDVEAGATFSGAFTLPNKTGTGWILIRSTAFASLPARGTRVIASDATNMPKITLSSATSPVIDADDSAHNYWLLGIEVETTHNNSSVTWSILSLDDMADVAVDRCYIHGTAGNPINDGILFDNTTSGVCIDSLIKEVHATTGGESHGIHFFQGGNFLIQNNRIEAAGENIISGGYGVDLGPGVHDLTIRGNHLWKDSAWVASWHVKNSFELKEGTRVLFEGNLCENNYVDAQSGRMIVFTDYDDDITDVTLRKNIFYNSPSGFNISKQAGPGMSNILIEDNIIYIVGDSVHRFFLFSNGPDNIIIRHNTCYGSSDATLMYFEQGSPDVVTLTAKDNIFHNIGFGLLHPPTAQGLASVQAATTTYDFDTNLSVSTFYTYSEDSTFKNWQYEDAWADVGFFDSTPELDAEDFRLTSGTHRAGQANDATDGTDMGVDIDALIAALNGEGGTPPTITSNGGGATANISIAENLTAVTTVTATGDAPVSFSKSGTDNGFFSINSSTGELAFSSAPDYESPADSGANNIYDVTVTATNGSGSDSQDIAITITDIAMPLIRVAGNRFIAVDIEP